MDKPKKSAFALLLLIVSVLVVVVVVGTFVMGLGEEVGKEVDSTAPGQRYAGQPSDQTEFDIRTGEMSVESDDASSDARELKETVRDFGGEVEEETRNENQRRVTHSVKVRVPSEEFEEFVDRVQENYDVTEAEIHYETVDVSRTRNEVEVLLYSMGVYEAMINRLNSSRRRRVDPQTVSVVSHLTNERLELARKLNDLNYDVAEVEQRAELPTVEVTFREKRKASVLPDDFGGDVRAEVGGSLDSVSSNVAKLVALPFAAVSLFLVVIRYIVYLGAIMLPFAFIYVVARRVGIFEN